MKSKLRNLMNVLTHTDWVTFARRVLARASLQNTFCSGGAIQILQQQKNNFVRDFYTRIAYKRWLHLQEITVVLTQERKRQSTPDIADMARICGRKKEVHWKWNTEGHLFDRAGYYSDSKTIFTFNSLLDDNFLLEISRCIWWIFRWPSVHTCTSTWHEVQSQVFVTFWGPIVVYIVNTPPVWNKRLCVQYRRYIYISFYFHKLCLTNTVFYEAPVKKN